jgi:hypothetical protein
MTVTIMRVLGKELLVFEKSQNFACVLCCRI